MQKQTIIILHDGQNYEAYGSLAEICRIYNLPYKELVVLTFPFEYAGWSFNKTTFRQSGNLKTAEEVKELQRLLMSLALGKGSDEAKDYLKSKELWID
jgi:hypothetical protein